MLYRGQFTPVAIGEIPQGSSQSPGEPTSRRTHVLVWALVLIGLFSVGCGRPHSRSAHRIIERDPTDLFDPYAKERLCEEVISDFREPDALLPWKLHDLEVVQINGSGFELVAKTWDPTMTLPNVAIDARQVDFLQIELSGLDKGSVQIFWSGKNEPFSQTRTIKLLPHQNRDGVFTFPVVSHPEWTGRVDRLRVDPASSAGQRVKIVKITAARTCTDEEDSDLIHSKAWKVDLGGTVANALPCLADRSIVRELDIGGNSVLVADIGGSPRLRVPVAFKVSIATQTQPATEVFRRRVDNPGEGTWHSISVPLSEWSGQRVRIVLSTEAEGGQQPDMGVPFWADPRIISDTTTRPSPNIILISVDTLRADHLSLYGYDRTTSPEISRWASSRGVVFKNVIAPAPWTHPSHLSMFTGLDALSHGINHETRVGPGFDLLSKRLRRRGYATWAVTGGVYLHPEWGFEQGFDRFHYWKGADSEHELQSGLDTAIELLRKSDGRPFFLFFHTYEAHVPYRQRQPFFDHFHGGTIDSGTTFGTRKDPLSEENGYMKMCRLVQRSSKPGEADTILGWDDTDAVVAAYDSGVAYLDSKLGELFDFLEGSGLAEDTIVVLTSDHGEALGEKELANHTSLYDFLLRVPLVISGPGIRSRQTQIEHQVRLIDIVPTLLDLAGFPEPDNIDGVSLAPTLRGETQKLPNEAWSYAGSTNYGVSLRQADGLKIILNNAVWAPVSGGIELYDLSDDPGEIANLETSHPQASIMREAAIERLQDGGSGLVLHFDNSGTEDAAFLLSGNRIGADRIKSWDLPSPQVKLLPEGALEVTLPAQTVFFLVLEGTDRRGITIKKPGPNPQQWDLLPTKTPEVLTAFSRSGAPMVEITAEWRRVSEQTEDRVEPSPAMLEQLRALGYVE